LRVVEDANAREVPPEAERTAKPAGRRVWAASS
ncbi:MAG: hypothetical protein ACI80N_004349, partial [Gammaproteobacteria bacterium]